MSRLRFGYFMAPFHAPGRNPPTAALERDLDLVEHLDHLGYDEAWFGEHHSAGSEIIASPEIMIAAAPSERSASDSVPASPRSPTTIPCGRPTASCSSTT